MDKITITQAQFKDISAEVAATLIADYDDWCEKNGISGNGLSTMHLLTISAILCAKLDTALFEDNTLEVESK